MENLKTDVELGSTLRITFPASSEDHRLQLVGVNGAIFAIVHSPLESNGPILLHCEEWSLVLLAPLKSKSNIRVSAKNVICLNEIASEEGDVNIHASNRLIKFDDDPGAVLYFYRLFEDIVSNVRSKSPELVSQAEQQFVTGFCTLADKIKKKREDLDLFKVLKIWNIPRLKD